jgi:hypothetical protein
VAVGMPELIPPLAHFLMSRQQTIHRPLGAEVPALVEQRGVHFGRCQVHEPWLVQHGEDIGPLAGTERAGRGPARPRAALGPPPSVVGRPRQAKRCVCRGDAEPGSHLGHGRHQERTVSSDVPSNAESFLALPGFGWLRACAERSTTSGTFPAGDRPGEVPTSWTTGACMPRFSG